jgi:hypothetical protein
MAEYEEEYESYDEYEEYEEYEYEYSDDEKGELQRRGSSSSAGYDEQTAGLMDPDRLKVQIAHGSSLIQPTHINLRMCAGEIQQSCPKEEGTGEQSGNPGSEG